MSGRQGRRVRCALLWIKVWLLPWILTSCPSREMEILFPLFFLFLRNILGNVGDGVRAKKVFARYHRRPPKELQASPRPRQTPRLLLNNSAIGGIPGEARGGGRTCLNMVVGPVTALEALPHLIVKIICRSCRFLSYPPRTASPHFPIA